MGNRLKNKNAIVTAAESDFVTGVTHAIDGGMSI